VLLLDMQNLPAGPALTPDLSDAAYEASLRRGLDHSLRDKGPHPEETLAHLAALAVHLERVGRRDEARSLREEHKRVVPVVASALKARAGEAYLASDYARAERLLRSLIASGFEVVDALCDLGRILLAQDDPRGALAETAAAWKRHAEARPYIVPRILWLQLALLYWPSFGEYEGDRAALKAAELDSAQVILGRLKTVLACEGAHMEWAMDPVLGHLQPKLPAEQHQLLGALVAALNDATNLPALKQFPAWRDTQPEPLE
jgi:hypothetical protein